jgi:putative endonuclease
LGSLERHMARSKAADELGRRGEEMARSYLAERGYAFIERNWHRTTGEIDLVMREGIELVFVEVKTRFGDGAGRAEDAVSRAKARKLLTTCEWYVNEHPEIVHLVWRCDLIAITFSRTAAPEIAHYENAIVIG